jgi:hypothetical protein
MCVVLRPIAEFPFRIYALFAAIHPDNRLIDSDRFAEYHTADLLSTFQFGLGAIDFPRPATTPITALSYRRALEPSPALSLPDLSTVLGSQSPLFAPFFECEPARDAMSLIVWPYQ